MNIVKSEKFGTVTCDLYKDANRDVWMTREQIGKALEYEDPVRNISKVHARNTERLDPLSVVVRLTATDGKSYCTTVYSRKGIMEICRFSRQTKADAFMDWAWEVMDSVIKTGNYSLKPRTDDEMILYSMQLLKARCDSQAERIKEMEPKEKIYDLCMESESAIPIGIVARMFGYGRNRFYDLLRKHGIMMDNRTPYQEYSHYFKMGETAKVDRKGVVRVFSFPMVKQKGLDFLARKLGITYQKELAAQHA